MRNRNSILSEVSVILRQSIASEGFFLTDMKRPAEAEKRASILMCKAPYDSYDSAVTFLRRGFHATKFNYSNTGRKEIKIWLSDNQKYLMYHDVGQSCMAKLIPNRKLYLQKIVNYMYGG